MSLSAIRVTAGEYLDYMASIAQSSPRHQMVTTKRELNDRPTERRRKALWISLVGGPKTPCSLLWTKASKPDAGSAWPSLDVGRWPPM